MADDKEDCPCNLCFGKNKRSTKTIQEHVRKWGIWRQDFTIGDYLQIPDDEPADQMVRDVLR